MLSALLFCSGCTASTGDGLLALPKLPGEYVMLQKKLDELEATGAKLVTADSGPNRQAVQLIDLDGNGDEEAVSFFHHASGRYTAHVFARTDKGYEERASFGTEASSLRAVNYPVCDVSGKLSIAMSWGIDDAGSYGMTIFDAAAEGMTELLDVQYSGLTIADIDGDTVDEICIVTRDGATGAYAFRMYAYRGNTYKLICEAPLCAEVKTVGRMKVGKAENGGTEICIDSMSVNAGYVTDLISIRGSRAVNETIDEASHSGILTWRPTSVFSTDIDGDGILEIPTSAVRDTQGEVQSSDLRNKLIWKHFKGGEEVGQVATTYHSVSEEWYINWPERWENVVNVSRYSSSGISVTTFYLTEAAAETPYEGKRNELLSIYVFSGESRANSIGGSIKILRQTSTKTYGYLLPDTRSERKLTDTEVAELFHTIEKEWSSGGYIQ